MVDQDLVRELLKQLEAEKGCAVQLRVDTPLSERGRDVEDYFGAFSQRAVTVCRVSRLNKRYFSDVTLIEGEYKSLEQLQGRIQELNALHEFPCEGSIAARAYELVEQKMGVKTLVANYLALNFDRNPRKGITAEQVYTIMEEAGIQYLKYNIVARPDGVYDDRTFYGGISIIDRTKVADIRMKLIE